MVLMHQFAADLEEQLGEEIPQDVRSDPVRYEAFVRERFAAALQGPASGSTQSAADTELSRRANTLVNSSSSGGTKKSFLDRLMKSASSATQRSTSTRVKVVAVNNSGGGSKKDEKRTGLLSDQDNV